MTRTGGVWWGAMTLWLASGQEACLGQEGPKEVEAVISKSVNSDSGMRFLVTKNYDGTPNVTETQIAMFDDLNEQKGHIYPPRIDKTALQSASDKVYVTVESGYFAKENGEKTALPDEAKRVFITFKLAGADADKYRLTNPGPHCYDGKINVKKIDVDIPDNKKAQLFTDEFLPKEKLTKIVDDNSFIDLGYDKALAYTDEYGNEFYVTGAFFCTPDGGNDKTVGKRKGISLWYELAAKDESLYRLKDAQGGKKTLRYCQDCGAIVKRDFTITLPNPQIEYGEAFNETVSPPPKNSWQTFANYGKENQYDLIKAGRPQVGEFVLTVIAYEEDNYAETRKDFNVSVSPKPLKIAGTPVIASRPYDGTSRLGPVTLPTLDKTNVLDGDTVSLIFDRDETAVRPDAGTYTVSFTPRLTNPNYTLERSGALTAQFTISPATSTTLPTLQGDEIPTSKTYDGTTDIDLPDGGAPLPDGMRICAARFDGAGAGRHKITVDICLDGNHMTTEGKSAIEGVEYPTTGTISQKILTLAGEASIKPRQYDGTVGVERRLITLPALEGVADGDDVALYCYATLDNAWAGERTVTISLSIGGSDSRNYALAESVIRARMTVLPRTKRGVKIVVRNAGSLVYGHHVVGVLPSDDVRIDTDPIISGTTYIDGRASAVSLPVGENMPLRVRFVPVDTLNYQVVDTTILVSVRPLQLSLAGETSLGGRREYDGTDDALALVSSTPSVAGSIGGDDVALAVASARMDSKSVGERTVTVRYALTGEDAGNYTLADKDMQAVASTTVYAKALTITPPQFSSTTKEHDGTTAAPPTAAAPALVGAVEGDDVTLSWTAEYDSPDVGDRLIVISYDLGGADAGNYTAPTRHTESGSIVAKEPEPTPTPEPEPEPTPTPEPEPEPSPEPEYQTLEATATVATESLCADEALTVSVEVSSGIATTWSITFDNMGQKAGYRDVAPTVIPPAEGDAFTIVLPTPPTEFFGTIEAMLTLSDERSASLPLALRFARRPDASHLHVKFGNSIVMDNVSGNVASYQWTADGMAIPGATRQFYHANPLPAAEYAVEVSLTDGTRLTSCPLTAGDAAPAGALSAFPNPVRRGGTVTIRTGGEDRGDLIVEVYNPAGEMVRAAGGERFDADLPRGVYFCRIRGEKVAGNVKLVVK